MKIDKTSFLLLAGALALGACSSDDSSDGTGGSGGGPGGTGGTAGEGGTGGTAGEGGAGGGGTGGTAGEGGTGAVGGSAGEAGSGATGGAAGEAGSAGAGGTMCDDSIGSPKDCSLVPTEECGDWATDTCEDASTFLKPAVAEAAVDCMISITDCINPDPFSCVEGALANACPDATADADCAEIAVGCEITEDECHALYDGLTQDARDDVKECLTGWNADCEYGLWSCIESL